MAESVSFDRVAHVYDDTRGYTSQVAATIADGLMRVGPVPPGSRLLEIGIGTGRIALPLLERGVNLVGVDISPRMVERLGAKYEELRAAEPERPWGTLRVEMADMTTLPFVSGSFDAAVAVHVLHLVPDWQRALDEVLRAVKPGGALLLGQDVHSGASASGGAVQDEWTRIITALGYEPKAVGASSFSTILAELRRRGLDARVETLATWPYTRTPREALRYVASRVWSRTWPVPDAIFAESIQRLTEWTERTYAGHMDTPEVGTNGFKVARVAVR